MESKFRKGDIITVSYDINKDIDIIVEVINKGLSVKYMTASRELLVDEVDIVMHDEAFKFRIGDTVCTEDNWEYTVVAVHQEFFKQYLIRYKTTGQQKWVKECELTLLRSR